MARWAFAEHSPASVRRDPQETQLFKAEQAGEGEYAGTDALVREILQNSMDAGTGAEPVRVRMALHAAKDLPNTERLSLYFDRLRAPLAHRDIEFDRRGIPLLPGGFLVCEDFGTRGLGGDPFLSRDPEPGGTERQDFFWFWRNIGRSGKTGDDLGRWGLGKTVYRAASRVGCMFGLTVREHDRRQFLMGQAVLKMHPYQKKEYAPEGFWCASVRKDGLPMPIDATDELQTFREEWKLTRIDQAGLSVVVPYVACELTGNRLMQAVCVNFFMPILRGELIVTVAAPDISPCEAELTSESLMDWAKTLRWDGPKRAKRHAVPPFDFIKRCISHKGMCGVTEILGRTKLPELSVEAFAPETLTALRERLRGDDLLRVRVRMYLLRKHGDPQEAELSVFVQRQDESEKSDTYFVREGMTITKLNSKASQRGFRSLVLVDKGPLAQLLGDAEGPSHEDWDTSEERPDRLWKMWKGRVTFCRKIVDTLLEVLEPPNAEADFDLLSDFFSVEHPEASQKSRKPSDNGRDEAAFGRIPATPRWFRVDPKRGGFRLTGSAGVDAPPKSRLLVSVAYDVASGNPLKLWSAFDFDFFNMSDRLSLRGEFVRVKIVSGNVLRLEVDGGRFWFTAEGFDQHADLYLRVEEEELVGKIDDDSENADGGDV